jgi:hypothetical protein
MYVSLKKPKHATTSIGNRNIKRRAGGLKNALVVLV